MDFFHHSQHPALHPFGIPTYGRTRHALIAHLGGDAGSPRGPGQLAGLPNRVGQRLLAIDMPSLLHGPQRRWEVRVVGRRNSDRVDLVAQLIEHFPPIGKSTGRGEGLARLGQTSGIHIANPYHVLGGTHLGNIGPPFSAHADGRDSEPLIGSQHPTATDIRGLASGQIGSSGEHDGIPEKLTA